MLNLPAATWVRFVVWMAVGLAVYSLYGRRHSRLRAGGELAPGGQTRTAGAPGR